LHVAQPALSRAVQELEEFLGTRLLERTRRSVSLTPSGAALLHECGILVERRDEVIRRIRRIASGEEGELRLGYIGPPTQNFLGPIVGEFRRRFPRVSVILEERTPERVWEMVANGRLAIGLTRPALGASYARLETTLLRKESFCAVFPQEHEFARLRRVPWARLKDSPLIILARRESVGQHEEILAACREAQFLPRLAHTPSLISTVLTYVEAGAGVGIIPETMYVEAGAGVGIIPETIISLAASSLTARPLAPARSVDLVMVWPADNPSPVLKAFRLLVQEWRENGLLWKSRG
jgi:DNA-binding transcriptional LysR family regulator